MSASQPEPIPVYIAESEWQELIANAHKPCDYWDRSILFDASAKNRAEGNYGTADLLNLLGQVTSYALQTGPGTAADPFHPIAVFSDGTRCAIPADLTDEELNTLESLAPQVTDLDLKARIHDVLFLRGRGFGFALAAVSDYLKSSALCRNRGAWLPAVRSLERGVRLAGSIRRGNEDLFDNAIRVVEEALADYDDSADRKMMAAALMQLLLEFQQGDAVVYRRQAEVLAGIHEFGGHWEEARDYWELAAAWDQRGSGTQTDRLRAAAAETYVKAAEEAIAQEHIPNTMAASQIADVVLAFRQIGDRNRSDELHVRLIELQKAGSR